MNYALGGRFLVAVLLLEQEHPHRKKGFSPAEIAARARGLDVAQLEQARSAADMLAKEDEARDSA